MRITSQHVLILLWMGAFIPIDEICRVYLEKPQKAAQSHKKAAKSQQFDVYVIFCAHHTTYVLK